MLRVNERHRTKTDDAVGKFQLSGSAYGLAIRVVVRFLVCSVLVYIYIYLYLCLHLCIYYLFNYLHIYLINTYSFLWFACFLLTYGE